MRLIIELYFSQISYFYNGGRKGIIGFGLVEGHPFLQIKYFFAKNVYTMKKKIRLVLPFYFVNQSKASKLLQ
jgi:hypothetical protein